MTVNDLKRKAKTTHNKALLLHTFAKSRYKRRKKYKNESVQQYTRKMNSRYDKEYQYGLRILKSSK